MTLDTSMVLSMSSRSSIEQQHQHQIQHNHQQQKHDNDDDHSDEIHHRPSSMMAEAQQQTTSTTTAITSQQNLKKIEPDCDTNKKQQNCSKLQHHRSVEELIRLIKQENFDLTSLSNEEIIELMLSRQVSVYKLESILGKNNAKRCVEVRRQYYIRELELLDKLDHLQQQLPSSINEKTSNNQQTSGQQQHQQLRLPRADVLREAQTSEFGYDRVVGACCENVVGYVRLPVGLVGPLKLDNQIYYVPLATTEGCLVASTSRGLSALAQSGGVFSRIQKNCMTRAPIIRFQDQDIHDAKANIAKAIDWLSDPVVKEKIKTAFRSTSKHTNLIDYSLHPHGREIHIRFEAQTGDAMGMNMSSKGAEMALREMQRVFPTMDISTLSGNMCTDKKPSSVNWICGRGKSVECYATLSAEIVEKVFKVSVNSLIEVWLKKVMIGSAKAGSIGGFNCHAANIVAAIFIATGQDAAQVVSSSNCLITLEKDQRGALEVYCEMPSIECGTVGGGTVLHDQSSYLQLMGIRGSTIRNQGGESATSEDVNGLPENLTDSDNNACRLARIICATVMAAELSLLASLTEGTLVKSHMTHNRSAQPCKVV